MLVVGSRAGIVTQVQHDPTPGLISPYHALCRLTGSSIRVGTFLPCHWPLGPRTAACAWQPHRRYLLNKGIYIGMGASQGTSRAFSAGKRERLLALCIMTEQLRPHWGPNLCSVLLRVGMSMFQSKHQGPTVGDKRSQKVCSRQNSRAAPQRSQN